MDTQIKCGSIVVFKKETKQEYDNIPFTIGHNILWIVTDIELCYYNRKITLAPYMWFGNLNDTLKVRCGYVPSTIKIECQVAIILKAYNADDIDYLQRMKQYWHDCYATYSDTAKEDSITQARKRLEEITVILGSILNDVSIQDFPISYFDMGELEAYDVMCTLKNSGPSIYNVNCLIEEYKKDQQKLQQAEDKIYDAYKYWEGKNKSISQRVFQMLDDAGLSSIILNKKDTESKSNQYFHIGDLVVPANKFYYKILWEITEVSQDGNVVEMIPFLWFGKLKDILGIDEYISDEEILKTICATYETDRIHKVIPDMANEPSCGMANKTSIVRMKAYYDMSTSLYDDTSEVDATAQYRLRRLILFLVNNLHYNLKNLPIDYFIMTDECFDKIFPENNAIEENKVITVRKTSEGISWID